VLKAERASETRETEAAGIALHRKQIALVIDGRLPPDGWEDDALAVMDTPRLVWFERISLARKREQVEKSSLEEERP
jgi:hypothetical protein